MQLKSLQDRRIHLQGTVWCTACRSVLVGRGHLRVLRDLSVLHCIMQMDGPLVPSVRILILALLLYSSIPTCNNDFSHYSTVVFHYKTAFMSR